MDNYKNVMIVVFLLRVTQEFYFSPTFEDYMIGWVFANVVYYDWNTYIWYKVAFKISDGYTISFYVKLN